VGGVISPLLANIALHGLENRVQQAFPGGFTKVNGKTTRISPPGVIRYADDFVVMHKDLNVIHKCKTIIAEWLKDMGLELKDSKTQITHTLKGGKEYNTGFDFLGFFIRQHPVGKHQTQSTGRGYTTLIKPSKKKVIEHAKELAKTVQAHKTAPQEALIKALNPLIRGWANYYRTGNSSETYSTLDSLLYIKLKRWAERRHPNKNKGWCASRSWGIDQGKGWEFSPKNSTIKLLKYRHTKVISPGTKDQYVKVKGESSPYDGDWAYWASRTGKHPELSPRISKLLNQQKGKCSHCGLHFNPESLMEVHHKDKNHKNNKWENLELIHLVCHDRIHGEQHYDTGTQEQIWMDDISISAT
jgi:RNA-directed DNA polymerase